MATRIGLMGFGRIGRNVFRILHGNEDVEVTAISDTADPPALEYLLKFDTVMGRYPGEVSLNAGNLQVAGREVPLVQGREPGDVDWRKYGVDVVIEATARYRTRESLEKHLSSGAGSVILCVPPVDDPDITVVMGVNDADLAPEHRIISAASCTANCLAPVAKILHQAFKIEQGFVSTIHAYTNDQRLADVPAGDMRRSRAAAENIIPTDTRAHEMVMSLIPGLEGRLAGLAMNVPIPDGSVIDFVAHLGSSTTPAEVNSVVRESAEGEMAGIVQFEPNPIVSSDVIGNPHSAVFDVLATKMLGDDMVKVLAWFDNGWGYANRVVDLVKKLADLKRAEVRS